jgi:hypothetical protein
MSNRNMVVLGLAAIGVLLAVALLVVARGTGPDPAPALGADAAAAAGGARSATAGPGEVAAAGTPVVPAAAQAPPAAEPEITPPVISGRRSAAERIDWDRVPIAARVGQLGPDVSGAVVTGLRNARAQMESCFADEAKLLAAGGGPRFDPANPPTGPGALTLRLQSRAGGVDVVDTEVVTLGTSSAQLVSCVRHVLEGWPVDAPKAAGGRRYRLRYTIQ